MWTRCCSSTYLVQWQCNGNREIWQQFTTACKYRIPCKLPGNTFKQGRSVYCLLPTQIRNKLIRSYVYSDCPDIWRYQVTDLIWLRYHGHLVEFECGKYLIVHLFGSLQRHIRHVWSRHGYFDSTTSRQNTNHSWNTLTWYSAETNQKGTIRYHYLVITIKIDYQKLVFSVI